MTALNTLDDLLIHELQDLYSAEKQLVEALPKTISAVSHDKLREALEHHLEETKGHVNRLVDAFNLLGVPVKSDHCHGMEGLLKEAEEDMAELGDPVVKDAAIIGAAQRVEHYEIAGYGTAATLARETGRDDVAKLLKETLAEEKSADDKLTKVATGGWMKSGVNQEAAKV